MESQSDDKIKKEEEQKQKEPVKLYYCADCLEEISKERYEEMGDLCEKCEPSYYKESY